jgi:hypothetical protein
MVEGNPLEDRLYLVSAPRLDQGLEPRITP